MTIKEIEIESGMPRANIRFYETEGLLNPERRANGYREYSDEDLEILMKIKLLRALHISLEEIKSLHTGERALLDTLNQHLAKLEREAKDIEKAQKICKIMQSDGVQYRTLDAKHYLKVIEQNTKEPVELPASDLLPKLHIPWRRYFARTLDYAIYTTLWNVALIMNVNISEYTKTGNLLDTILILLIMLLVEPILLCLFGTTPGKWILGIRVTDNEGRRLTYSEARARTRSVLLRGMGLSIPIYSLYRLWKSYKADSDGETLDWEYHSEITLKDERGWRIFAYLGARAALIGMLVLSIAMSGLPKNRGDITVAQFCENYNYLAKYYYGQDTFSLLDSEGNWTQYGSTTYGVSFGGVSFGGNHELPDFIFEEQDGVMTGMHFSVHVQGDEIVATNMEEMLLSILAFAGAQKGSGPFHNQTKGVIENISESPFESFQYSVYGVNIACDVEYSGYFYTNLGMLWPQDGMDHYYSLTFSMQKEDAL